MTKQNSKVKVVMTNNKISASTSKGKIRAGIITRNIQKAYNFVAGVNKTK